MGIGLGLPPSVLGNSNTTAATPVGSAPVGSTYAPVSGATSDPLAWLSGSADFTSLNAAQNSLYQPNAANYTIGGANQYQTNQNYLGNQYAKLGNTAQAQSNLIAGNADTQNTDYQNNVNSTTGAYLSNNGGLGNYDNSLASQGSAQQNSAYNAITNMANGNGPSLAAKNLQAGLNQQNQAAHAQSMSNQGLGGAGNAQRNLGNQQTANTNNALESGQQASVAEQLGALGQENTAANNIRSANQAQASAASSAGLTQRSQNATALANQYSAQLAGNTAANNTQLSALGQGYTTGLAGLAGQTATSNNVYNSNVAQQQANQAWDTAMQNQGNTRAQIYTNATQAGAAQSGATTALLGNIAGGIGSGVSNYFSGGTEDDASSDQNMKTNIDTSGSVGNALQGILGSINNAGLANDISNHQEPTLSQQPGVASTAKPASSGSSTGSTIGSVLGTIGTALAFLL